MTTLEMKRRSIAAASDRAAARRLPWIVSMDASRTEGGSNFKPAAPKMPKQGILLDCLLPECPETCDKCSSE